MQLSVLLVLFLLFSVKSFEVDQLFGLTPVVIDEDYVVRHALGRNPDKLFCENELNQLFDAFGRNDSQQMEEIYHHLEELHFDVEKLSTKKESGINVVVILG